MTTTQVFEHALQDLLRREVEDAIIATVEDVLEVPATVKTPVCVKFSSSDEGLLLTVLRFECRLDA